MATCAISGNLLNAAGEALVSADVYARVSNPVVSGSSIVTPERISTTTNSSGDFTLTLQQSISVLVTVQYPITDSDSKKLLEFVANVPAAATATFSSIIVTE